MFILVGTLLWLPPLVIFDYNVVPSIHGPFPSSLTLFSPYNFNPSNPNHEDVIMS